MHAITNRSRSFLFKMWYDGPDDLTRFKPTVRGYFASSDRRCGAGVAAGSLPGATPTEICAICDAAGAGKRFAARRGYRLRGGITRVTRRPTRSYAITTPLLILHDQQCRDRPPKILARLRLAPQSRLVCQMPGSRLNSDPCFKVVAGRPGSRPRLSPQYGVLTAVRAGSTDSGPSQLDVFIWGFLPPREAARRPDDDSADFLARDPGLFSKPARDRRHAR